MTAEDIEKFRIEVTRQWIVVHHRGIPVAQFEPTTGRGECPPDTSPDIWLALYAGLLAAAEQEGAELDSPFLRNRLVAAFLKCTRSSESPRWGWRRALLEVGVVPPVQIVKSDGVLYGAQQWPDQIWICLGGVKQTGSGDFFTACTREPGGQYMAAIDRKDGEIVLRDRQEGVPRAWRELHRLAGTTRHMSYAQVAEVAPQLLSC